MSVVTDKTSHDKGMILSSCVHARTVPSDDIGIGGHRFPLGSVWKAMAYCTGVSRTEVQSVIGFLEGKLLFYTKQDVLFNIDGSHIYLL